MDELKPCPFCGQKAERSPINGSVCCPVRGIGKHTDYLRPDAWQTRPIEDALQRRVEKLEMNIKEAVKEIEDSMQSADWEVASVYDGALLILKNHGLVEDK